MLTAESTAPSYVQLRPLKPLTTSSFPVYPDATEILARADATHPDDKIAHLLATCSGYAYSTEDTVVTMMARMGLSDNRCRLIGEYVDAMFISSTSFLVQSNDGRVVILAYRGTEPANFINWLTDADVYPEKVAIPFGSPPATFDVHGGFYRNVRATRHEIVETLKRALGGKSICAKEDDVPHQLEALYITGHSLGGAMAAILAVMLVTEPAYAPLREKLRAVYTFGQPMIGSPDLAKACDGDPFLGKRVIRYIYRRDVVPHLPPTDSGPFRHFGPEYQYEEAWPWHPNPEPTDQMGNLLGLVEAPVAFLARQLRLFRNLRFQHSLADHGPHHYVSALTPPGVRSEFGDP